MKTVILFVLLAFNFTAHANDTVIDHLQERYRDGRVPAIEDLKIDGVWTNCRYFDVAGLYRKVGQLESFAPYEIQFSTFDGLFIVKRVAKSSSGMSYYAFSKSASSSSALNTVSQEKFYVYRGAFRMAKNGDLIAEYTQEPGPVQNQEVAEYLQNQAYPGVEFPLAKVIGYTICSTDPQ